MGNLLMISEANLFYELEMGDWMAQYKAPLDPRDPNTENRNEKGERKEPLPWRWLGLGVVVTFVGLGVGLMILRTFLLREPLPVDSSELAVVVLTAPPRPTVTVETAVVITTAMPTFTPVPTPNVEVAPDEITPGYYAQVANTDGIGVTVRGGPSTSNAPLTVALEDAILLVLDGPEEGNDFLWWQVRLEDGTEGWAVGDFLIPAIAP